VNNNDSSQTDWHWHWHVEQCRDMKTTQAEYCRRYSLSLFRFGYWHRKFNSTQSGNWLPVETKQSNNTVNAIDLVLGNARTLRITDGFDIDLLQSIIVAVEATA